MTNKNAYAQSGVDVEAGYEVVERIKKHVARKARHSEHPSQYQLIQ